VRLVGGASALAGADFLRAFALEPVRVAANAGSSVISKSGSNSLPAAAAVGAGAVRLVVVVVDRDFETAEEAEDAEGLRL
jgi:hypothetical protein